MTVAVDVDGVLRDFTGSLAKVYKEYYPEHEVQPVTEWGIERFFPIGRDIYRFAFEEHVERIFYDADIFPKALEFMTELCKKHKVVICTSQPKGKEWITLKWLEKHKIPYHAIVFTNDKSIVHADVLLDDATHNLDAFKGLSVAYSQPWNRRWDGFRVHSYHDLLQFLNRADVGFALGEAANA